MTRDVGTGAGGPCRNGPRIVVGVDGSGQSMLALAWAAHEANLRDAALEVIHVDFFRHEALEEFAPDMIIAEQAVLGRAVVRAKALEPGILVTGRVADPPAAQALIAASEGADLLVVGSRGLGPLKEMTMGSVSTECVHHAHCPVVVLRPFAEPERKPANGRLAVSAASSARDR